ncbi:MAG: hypothetical protein A3F12_02855 [Gammaproteobacteria bacterium RIFCSPHIGHO2_12_FULL_38_14]|nr:MAG: hypothetical protein A3F12_02855 [Gammaproteobacteria bacterium RIFCSPHIGHO2_12_FULL_38_14]
MADLKTLLNQALVLNSFNLNDVAKQQCLQYLALLQKWNRVFNLTAISDARDMVYLHLIDSLTLLPFLEGDSLLDVGSGAGFPGLPLAIVTPEKKWTLLDKNNKKTRFLTQVVAELKLPNVNIVHKRLQDFHPEICFDTIMTRAFGSLQMFAKASEPLLCKNGVLLAMKGQYPQDELNECPNQFILQDVTRMMIHGIEVERHIVRLRKKPAKRSC